MADTRNPPQSEDVTNNNQQPAAVSDEKEKKDSSSINLSDVNRLIREISDAKKNLAPEPPANISPEPLTRPPSFEQGEQAAQQGLSGAGRVGSRTAAQAGRVASQAVRRLAIQAGTRLGVLLFTTPVGWVIIAVGVVVIITLAIVLSVGGGGLSPGISPTSEVATPSSTLSPQEPSPTPAQP